MRVLKFGGTSVGSVQNMTCVKDILVSDDKQKIVVLSAMSGTTNALVAITSTIKNSESEEAIGKIQDLCNTYYKVIEDLLVDNQNEAINFVNTVFDRIQSFVNRPYTALTYNTIVAQGELLSVYLFAKFLEEQGIKSKAINALDFMRIDKDNEPDSFYIKQNINRLLSENSDVDIYVTQGFICLDAHGEITNLQRGGSDYTATIIGAAIEAEEVQIWTDIDGFHNNDPRFVEHTKAISNLSFDEAAELAYFGAKILHPQTVMPAREGKIPVRLKNTMQPDAYGTLITDKVHGDGIKAIAAKDGIVAIKIKSGRMLLAYGFLKKVFEIFEKYETPIDMITTSEIAVSLTIDDATYLQEITEELDKFAHVEVDDYRSIVCLVGHAIVNHPDTHKLFQILQDVDVRMISYGGSHNNISLLINTSDKKEALHKLHRYVFNDVNVLV